MVSVKNKPATHTILFSLNIVILFLLPVLGAVFQSDLKYQDRGDRHEGVKGTPVSDRVELISVTANYNERVDRMPDYFKLKFYLAGRSSVFVRVREIDNRHNYWMDKLRPAAGWRQGFGNEFRWPTQEVVQRLAGLKLYDLATVAQLDRDEPSSPDVRVAPVILFHSQPPRRIDGYSFTFEISRRADVTYTFSKDEVGSPALLTQSFKMQGRRPRTINWDASKASEGQYRLMINVVYANNGQEIKQIVRFYHRPNVR